MRFLALDASHADDAAAVINAAAQCYASFLPPAEWQPPEMTVEQWHGEARRMRWFGALRDNVLCAVMGLEPRHDAALIRHAYVAPAHQRQGIGGRLLDHVEAQVNAQSDAPPRRLIAGTYTLNMPARGLFERHGYVLSVDSEAVLRRYYAIPETRLRTSVTLVKVL